MKQSISIKSKAGNLIRYLVDSNLYVMHKITGTSYAKYYAQRMDFQMWHNATWGLDLNKKFQLEYLQKHGLQKNFKFLDYGCGAVNAGLHFIDYLDQGCYFGADVSAGVLKEGQRRIEERNLVSKSPTLLHLDGGDLKPLLSCGKFDIIWAQSVFTHMPPENIIEVLKYMPDLLKKSGVFYATFASSQSGVKHKKLKNWYYDSESIAKLSQQANLTFDVMQDWSHPDDPSNIDRLAKFTIA